ncbi:chemotaxis protein CheC [Phormidium sp. CCY1219]|uniref:chemotaxis protein CheC n=1 Tax=Phormidium sp. CCY1219 TaxID=2886104 RepID=UPI002D1F8F57|nr:chemotaxis protein CheC [Phormidium sp. CCY1219]MEB3827289.1 chemotaxis protein CheC [Phormidium sp. CCY1219]
MNLTVEQLDALQELVNIGVGRAASVLNEMIDSHIRLQVPFIRILSPKRMKSELEERLGISDVSAVRLGFSGSFSGTAQLVFPTDSASKLVALLTNEEVGTPDLDAVKIGTLTEVGNIVINGVMGSMSNLLHQHLNYSLPIYLEDTVDNLLVANRLESKTTVLLAQARFTIEQLQIAGDIILIFKVGSFDVLLAALEMDYGDE